MQPIRIQRSRQHKQVSPNGLPIVYVGRPGKWGNPFSLKQCYVDAALYISVIRHEIPNCKVDKIWVGYANAIAIQKYKSYMSDNPGLIELAKKDLKGKNLSCWCKKDEACHADILLQIANQ